MTASRHHARPLAQTIIPALALAVLLAACQAAPVIVQSPLPTAMNQADHPTRIAVHWEVLDNHQDGSNSFRSALTLTNRDPVPLPATGWTLYFNFLRAIVPESVPPAFTITHINGDFFSLAPTDRFEPLMPGERVVIPFDALAWAIKYSDAPAGFYFVFTDAQGRPGTPQPVDDVSVGSFLTRNQTDRLEGDPMPVTTAASRYAANAPLMTPPAAPAGRIIPTPVVVTPQGGQVVLDATWAIHHGAGLAQEAGYLAASLAPLLGTHLPVRPDETAGARVILLQAGPLTVEGVARDAGQEAYRLVADPNGGIVIRGTDGAGVLYGIQSLRAWLPPDAYRRAQRAVTFDAVAIEDAPRFGYRGLMLDVGRNFQTKATVLKLLDLMAFYKLNKFHFHLTDDEGWRLEVSGLPELTSVGGRRGHTTDERDHLAPSYGSGPTPDGPPGSGFYSRDDFIEILRYATERHIEVITEIDVPGHARAAIKAMETRYTRLRAQGDEAAADAFRLIDPQDASVYRSVQMWDDNVLNVCQPGTYRFLQAVFDDLAALYEAAGAPLTTIHIGGDEVPHGVWAASPLCQALIRDDESLESTDDLWAYFVGRTNALLQQQGLVTAGWEEIAMAEHDGAKTPNPAFLGHNMRLHVWNNVWGWGSEDIAYRLANLGYDVVLSNATNLYFDLAYNKDPEEPGYYWASFVDTRKAFEFVPLDLYKSAWVDRMGAPLDADALYADHVRLTTSGVAHILGLQGQLWGENGRSPDVIEYLGFPKLLGLAERAWARQPAWARLNDAASRRIQLEAAWKGFAYAVGQRELMRLDYLYGGVAYRLPPPGAVVEDGLLKANTAYPGLTIRYTTDGTEPTPSSLVYRQPVRVTGPVRLGTFDTRGRQSRTVAVE